MVYSGGGNKAEVVAGSEFSCILPKLFYVNNKMCSFLIVFLS